ncbi:PAS domain-containing protein [Qipengyuania sp. S6317L1]|uniref:sensor histidine kinase n=1 Tax=Qipengyuania sp. S6317L1 TaxID=2926410 RepID=UPI001FF69ACA|nr:HWE histidine kinase domain-containing protein [Qipengyuania sp. S6317L1]MCK0099029.1 PAS domain-containing protein [Qipengyuania sp. S6317L1]
MPDLKPFEQQSAEHLRLVLEFSQIGIWDLDLRSGQAVRNATHDRIFGYDEPLPEWRYDQFLTHVVDGDRERVDELQKNAIEEGREWSFECQIRTNAGQFRWIKAVGRPLKDDQGEIIRLIGQVIDITDSRQNEARLQLITDELNHRVRNLLSVIKAIIKMTARRAKDVQGFSRALEGRVGALARAHNLLVGNSPASMTPSAILRAELSAFEDTDKRVQISINDEAALSTPASQGLALVFHELLTNSIKYGALSIDSGKVSVSIDRVDDTIAIVWTERDGPTVGEDRGNGFGTQLIARALASEGTTQQMFLPEGLECRITLAVDQV